ncbi:GGDEF domain-containing protein [Companilactobacillus hulinensis]|uniref:GGDEF domain-containing protein n=1 Tax=Companilactobacillus hulinensis TaxID=2486007 RepID=UPI000F792377|nr:GGDEF domain-containing protein [Companilactobacillus hulinensis]
MTIQLEAGIFQRLLNVDANINAIIIGLITVGIITILTVLSYSFEGISRKHKKWYVDMVLGLIEAAALVLSMILVQHIFKAINAGSSTNWFYATTQMTLMLYALYTMQNHFIDAVNIVAPLYVFGHHLAHENTNYNIFFVAILIVLAITVIYIAFHKNTLQSTEWKYLALQMIYGGIWWILIWSIYKFSPVKTIYMMSGFIVYMWAIRYVSKWIRNSFNNYNNMSEKVNYDELTGIRNRANFDAISDQIFKVYSHEKDIPLTMAMFDIDRFKNFNDEYGHLAGDMVLHHVAEVFHHQLFKQTTRGQLFRYGGEEFVIVFRGLDTDDSVEIIRNIRNELINDPLYYNGNELNIRISFGVSQLAPADRNFKDFFKRVDHYLYESKKSGRNRITIEDETFPFETNM